MPIQGSAPNPFAKVINSCICSFVMYCFLSPFADLHSIAKMRPFFPAMRSGFGKGVDPLPAALTTTHPWLKSM